MRWPILAQIHSVCMKNNRILILFLLGILFSLSVSSCKKDEENNPTPVPAEGFVELSGDLATQTLDPAKKYLLKGYVFVQSGQVLTIPAGTVIFGDKATKGTLVINRGGKILAEGTALKPIVFTSKLGPGERDKGDWGGIILLGNANVNQANTPIEGVSPAVNFGTFNATANDSESSGVLKYVRVEFAGIALSPNNEINGITFGGVGSGTVVENVQVSYSGDDAFEWFGGTVNCKNLIAFGTWDDDFDTDFGYTGKVQFALSVRDPFYADQSGSNAFESDNDASGTAAQPKTAPVFSNVSVFGPRHDSTSSISSNYQHAAHLRRNTATSIYNSVITGFPIGLRLDGSAAMANYTSGTGEVKNNLLISLGNRGAARPFMGSDNNTPISSDSVKNYYTANNPAGYVSKTSQANYAAMGINVNLYYSKNTSYPANPDFSVSTGVISTGANFTHNKLGGGFFQTVPFHGAFGASDWTDGWATFDPKNQVYP
jgi:hypothetical protein